MTDPFGAAPRVDSDDAAQSSSETVRIDIEEIARLVYQLMLEDLAIGRERGE